MNLKYILIPHCLVTLLGVSLLSGCKVGPEACVPCDLTNQAWKDGFQHSPGFGLERNAHWWTDFNDPVLNQLVSQAVGSNPDLKEAAFRVIEARARFGVAVSERFPELQGTGEYSYRRISGNSSPFSLISQDAFPLYSLGFSTAWQLDFWGKFRRAAEAAQAEICVAENDRAAVLLTLQSDVAAAYITIRSLEARIEVAKENTELQRQVLDSVEQRIAAGLVGAIDAEQAKTNLLALEATIPSLLASLEQAENRLSVLLGIPPNHLRDAWGTESQIPIPVSELVLGLPADLVRRRPDILAAEKKLVAETARVGVAVADLYPQLSLSGTITVDSTDVGTLFTDPSLAHNIGPAFSWNLFNFGNVLNQIRGQEAKVNQAIWSYRSVVLSAIQEVEDALVAYEQEQLRVGLLNRAEEAAKKSVTLAQRNYTQGLTRYQTVLDSLRTQLSIQDQVVVAKTTSALQRVALYQALGGGWSEAPVVMTAEPIVLESEMITVDE